MEHLVLYEKVSVVEFDLVESGSGVAGSHWLDTESPRHRPCANPEGSSLQFVLVQCLRKALHSIEHYSN